jgi:hypothetical protein
MENLVNKLFPEKGMGNMRLVVGTLLTAAVLRVLHFLVGGLGFIYYPLALILLIFPLYAAAQFLVPKMDPRDPDADRFVIYGSLASLILLGFVAFGWLFLPALIAAGGLVVWRAPDLAELLPWVDSGDHQVKM